MKQAARTPTRPSRESALSDRRPSRAWAGGDRWRPALALATALALCGSGACFGPATVDRERDAGRLAAARHERVETLRRLIDEDHATLQAIVSEERGEQARPIYAEPAVQAIARRLGPHEDELARLLAEAPHDDGASRMPR